MSGNYDCIIVGGGAIGLTIAWRVSQLGLTSIVCEGGPESRGASRAAAGMLAPVTEATYGESDLLELNLASARLYPDFLVELSEAAGVDIRSTVKGTLFAALDADELRALERLYGFQRSSGLSAEWLGGEAARQMEPALHPRTRAAVYAPDDLAVDPRALLSALVTAVGRAGGEIRFASPVRSIDAHPDTGVTLLSGEKILSSAVVLAAGCWSGSIRGAPGEVETALRPVKGQILRLRDSGPQQRLLAHVVRTEEVYLVPRRSGEIAVGASVEEKGYDTTSTAGIVLDLLTAADRAVPGIRELELTEISAGLRPGTPDNGPLLGPTSLPEVIAATGHFRNGILLAPITGAAIASVIAQNKVPAEIAPFGPGRFS